MDAAIDPVAPVVTTSEHKLAGHEAVSGQLVYTLLALLGEKLLKGGIVAQVGKLSV